MAPSRRRPSTAGVRLSKSSHGGSRTRRKPSTGEVTRSPACWKQVQQKTNSAESSRSSVSDSRRSFLLWLEGHSLTKYLFLYNLSFLVSSNPPMNRQVVLGAIELWQELLRSVSQSLSYLLGLSNCCPSMWGFFFP